MHPKFANTAIIAQRSGQFNFIDVDNTAINHLYHASMPSESATLTRMTVSPSGEAIAFADNEGILHVWGRGTSDSVVQFTEYPIPVEWPHIPQDHLPKIDVNDLETNLSAVGMPYYSTELLSSWPSHMTFEVGQMGQRIDEKSLKGLTRQNWYLYGRWNQPGRRRYQIEKSERVEELPRFRSQVEKERAFAGEDEESSEKVVGRFEGGEGGVPNYYKEVEIKYSKFGVEDFDFGFSLNIGNTDYRFYNPTPFSGLETHIANSYANSLLQVYHFTPSVRLYALAHTATTCRVPLCALCELGFLFQNLIDARGQNCQTTNFSRYLGSTVRAAGHDIVEEDLFHKESESKVAKINRLNRFLVTEGFYDNPGKGHHNHGPGHAQDRHFRGGRLWMDVIRLFRCAACGHEHSDKHREYVVEMVYHKVPLFKAYSDLDAICIGSPRSG
jgi:PAB-dependent poly(A)-specific ribonuclease subunit 2